MSGLGARGYFSTGLARRLRRMPGELVGGILWAVKQWVLGFDKPKTYYFVGSVGSLRMRQSGWENFQGVAAVGGEGAHFDGIEAGGDEGFVEAF